VPQPIKPARIILEDGTEFEGVSFGHESSVSGEIIAYTGSADIPRLLSDPALKGAILVLAQTDAGAAGIPEEDLCPLGLEAFFESSEARISGLVVSSCTEEPSHRTAAKSLPKWLKKQQVAGIEGIDTRALIQRIAIRGTMRAKILVSDSRDVSFSSAGTHSQPANVSTKKTVTYGNGPKKIVAVDCGVKNSAIRRLVTQDTSVIRVPCAADFTKDAYDAIFVGGAPGDPTSCEKTVAVLREALKANKPVFATGQGAVILALAGGAVAYRMAQGHQGSGAPCIDLENGRCYITAQNHGYGIRDASLPSGWAPTFLNNTDGTIEGFSAKKGLISGVLFNPEGNPGPDETDFLFERFLGLIRNGGSDK